MQQPKLISVEDNNNKLTTPNYNQSSKKITRFVQVAFYNVTMSLLVLHKGTTFLQQSAHTLLHITVGLVNILLCAQWASMKVQMPQIFN